MKVKLCGTTNVDDALMASLAGADYVGVVVQHRFSERIVSLHRAAEIAKAIPTPVICLFCDASEEFVAEAADAVRPFGLQLLGQESPEYVEKLKKNLQLQLWKSLFLPAVGQSQAEVKRERLKCQVKDYINAGADALLIDAMEVSDKGVRFGGTGKRVDWKVASDLIQKTSYSIFLSGGINPDNVEEAITEVKPFGIDLCSGVEIEKGKRDPNKVKLLMEKVERLKRR